MSTLYLAYVAMLGLAVGSFLNVLVIRYRTGKTLLGRSFCTACGHRLAARDLVPVVSFLFLRGRCRFCRSKLSWQYPAVELLTALLYFIAATRLLALPVDTESLLRFAELLVILPILLAVAVYDIRHKIIPDALVYTFAGLALLSACATIFRDGLSPDALSGLAAGPVLFLPFFLLWYLSRGRWMGLGDGKLALGIGWFLGLSGGISAVFMSFWAGALYGIAVMAYQRFQNILRRSYHYRSGRGKIASAGGLTMKSEVPFAPFLILGTLAVELFGFSLAVFGF